MKTETARKAVRKIVADLNGRRGLGDAWDDIDRPIRLEIMDEWTELVMKTINEAAADELTQEAQALGMYDQPAKVFEAVPCEHQWYQTTDIMKLHCVKCGFGRLTEGEQE